MKTVKYGDYLGTTLEILEQVGSGLRFISGSLQGISMTIAPHGQEIEREIERLLPFIEDGIEETLFRKEVWDARKTNSRAQARASQAS